MFSMALRAVIPAFLLAGVVIAQDQVQTQWGQCAGSAFAGPTICPQDSYCSFGNPWYSQCLPGTEDDPLPYAEDVPIQTSTFQTTITVTGGSRPTVVTTYITYLTPEPTPDPSSYVVISGVTYTYVSDSPSTRYPGVLPRRDAVITGTPAGAHAATPTTLQDGQYWIRAVASPNFHKYLQTSPANEVGVAVLGSSKTAGQFSVAGGQLVEWTGEGGSPLYLNVEKPADLTQRTLATWFNTTKNEFGTFVFQGDALTWSTPEINRQNLAAWLVCKNQELFINTGAYAYQTPEGCADQTIHYYNDKTAND
ncbi:hypothetical protein QBC33DRAFT_536526 [Phialemonium atrogriseum]|uniref:CBM1 domain-containing protein n=1 Tax=Phialemonium atrogriseum TaxID=1093897 RepID=A0AAJ0C144_9PEZI|nr:uncharacterized protein QBC33DRAFT_536526 [Phialemonium atrogriseum]KAK1768204.1 hypothetical protein QBC33DRAFT_536526 [Phialemonium atrogriseum]